MPPVFILQEFEGSITKEAARLDHAADAVGTMEGVLGRIAEDMMRIEKIVFDSQGRRGGGSWKPLDPATIKRKGSSRILVETGALEASLTEPGATFQVLKIGPNYVEFGTDHPAAEFHQEGTSRMPRRPLIKLVPGDITRWERMIETHLVRAHRV